MTPPEFLLIAERNEVRMFLALFCATFLGGFIVRSREQHRFFQLRPVDFYGATWRPFGQLDERGFALATGAIVAGLATAILGVLPRVSLVLALTGYVLYFSQILPLAHVRRKTNLLPIVLVILAISPGVDASFDTAVTRWPLWLVKAALAQMYLSAGIQKLRQSGWRWCGGRPLQGYLLEHFLRRDTRAAWWLAQRPRLCAVLSTATLIFELTFPVVLIVPFLGYAFAAAGVLLHAGIAWSMRVHYLKYLAPVYCVFLTEVAFTVWDTLARGAGTWKP